MSKRVARSPSLFDVPAGDGIETVLLGTRCSNGHVTFPPQTLGCEVCGAYGDAIEKVELAAEGRLTTFAVAHRDKRAGSTSPLIFGTVVLDAGPAVEVVLDVDDAAELQRGQRVSGHLAAAGEDESGNTVMDCYFGLAQTSAGQG